LFPVTFGIIEAVIKVMLVTSDPTAGAAIILAK